MAGLHCIMCVTGDGAAASCDAGGLGLLARCYLLMLTPASNACPGIWKGSCRADSRPESVLVVAILGEDLVLHVAILDILDYDGLLSRHTGNVTLCGRE